MPKNKAKVYDLIITFGINQTESEEYKLKIKRLQEDFYKSIIPEQKNEALNIIQNYCEQFRNIQKINLTFYPENYDHENIINGKIANKDLAENIKEYFFIQNKYLLEKLVIKNEKAELEIEGVGVFKGPAENILPGIYNLNPMNADINEMETNITSWSIINSSRKEIVEKIIENLKNGYLFTPEEQKSLLNRVYNPISGINYKGVNRLRLSLASARKNYKDPRWFTFSQAQANGYKIKKGERGILCEKWIFEKEMREKDEKTGKTIIKKEKLENPLSSYFIVFNAEQVVNIPKLEDYNVSSITEENLIKNFLKFSDLNINELKNTTAVFKKYNGKNLYIDLAYEMIHNLSHQSKSKESFINNSEEYIKYLIREKLMADIAIFYLSSDLKFKNLDNEYLHIKEKNYYGHYIKLLKENHNELFKICGQAEEISKILFDNYLSRKNLINIKKKE